MEVRIKSITHEVSEDAPFVGAVISAIGCNFKCKGCFNRDLKKLPTIVSTAKEIIEEVISNPFNEGIIFGGLEWSEQPDELIELIKEAVKENLKIMIYTGCDFDEFHIRIGQAAFKKYNQSSGLSKVDLVAFKLAGNLILQALIKGDYYIKTGTYDRTDLVDNNIPFGVKLVSKNQTMFLIKGEKK